MAGPLASTCLALEWLRSAFLFRQRHLVISGNSNLLVILQFSQHKRNC